MQLPKPILLEGSPGVGKTSLVSALAKAAGHNLVRINLSEQTDMMDLLGADLPADGGAAGEFRWADGAFLAALKNGDWVLLDELNLAPQPVLEGLNAALDHRAEVFVPERPPARPWRRIEAATVLRDTVSPPSRRSARIRGAPYTPSEALWKAATLASNSARRQAAADGPPA